MRRYIVLDIGKKRTGVALVDDLAKVGTPIEVIAYETTSKEFINRLQALIVEWEPTALVAGLPIDMKGKEAIAAIDVRERTGNVLNNINAVRKETDLEPLEIFFVDERLSTSQAERSMRDADVGAVDRKKLRDALAAAVIAQTFIDSL